MVFASAAVSAAQKPCQPLRNLRFQGTGHLFPFAQINIYSLHQHKSAALPLYRHGQSLGGFSPVGGGRGPARGEASIAHPLFPGKNKGAGLGVQGQRSSVLIHPDYISGIPEVCKCKHLTTSGIILRNSQPWRPSLSAVSHGQ